MGTAITRINHGQPILEAIEPDIGQSFRYMLFSASDAAQEPVWHYHPEIELVYIKNGKGKRHIGAHISYFTEGDLILIGPNLPHRGFTDRFTNSETEAIIQVKEEVINGVSMALPELKGIRELIKRAESGLSFYGKTKDYIGERLEDMQGMRKIERLLALIHIFDYLASSSEYKELNVDNVSLVVNHSDHERIKLVYDHVRKNYMDPIPLEAMARKLNMTIPSFCRYFKKHTHKTFTQYVNEYRIVHACKLLLEENTSISNIAYDCGFNNFSHFSRCFKKHTNQTPKEYRSVLREVAQ